MGVVESALKKLGRLYLHVPRSQRKHPLSDAHVSENTLSKWGPGDPASTQPQRAATSPGEPYAQSVSWGRSRRA